MGCSIDGLQLGVETMMMRSHPALKPLVDQGQVNDLIYDEVDDSWKLRLLKDGDVDSTGGQGGTKAFLQRAVGQQVGGGGALAHGAPGVDLLQKPAHRMLATCTPRHSAYIHTTIPTYIHTYMQLYMRPCTQYCMFYIYLYKKPKSTKTQSLTLIRTRLYAYG